MSIGRATTIGSRGIAPEHLAPLGPAQHRAALTSTVVSHHTGPSTALEAFEIRLKRLREAKRNGDAVDHISVADRKALVLQWSEGSDIYRIEYSAIEEQA